MARNGVITRRDVITDEAMAWGGPYAKNVEKAISANKKMVTGAKALYKVFQDISSIKGNSSFNTFLQNTAVLMQQISTAVTMQNAALRDNKNLINGLTSAQLAANNAKLEQLKIDRETQRLGITEAQRKKAEIALQEAQRRQSEALARAQQRQAKETLNQGSAYLQLQRRRNEAQRTLADLLSAENKNIQQIRVAQREFDILDARLKAVDAAIRNYTRNIGNYQSAFRGLNATMREIFSAFGITTGVALFGTILKDIFNIIKEFDRQLIAVGKTTNISGEDLKQFGREVVELGDKMDGISIVGLLKSAEVAGQLGVSGTKNILKFSEAVEKLKLTSNIISDEQVQNFAKFIEVSSDSFENADRLASVITQLGNNFASTEAEVLANATEIQKGTAVYKTSAEGVLALGAATSALGSEAEASRSAIQSSFGVLNNAIALNKNLAQVLKITGLSQEELTKQFGTDATQVFLKFVKGLSQAQKEGQNLSLLLNELDIKEKRAFTVVGSLAANYELLERAMFMASEEYKNNIALNKEVEAASQSIVSILGDIKDKFDAYILSTNDANEGTKKITTTLKFVRDNLAAIITAILKYGSIVLTFIGVQKTWNFVTTLWIAIQTAANAAQVRFALTTGIGTKKVLEQVAAIKAATAAQTGMNAAMSATPWGIIIALIASAVVAYQVFNDELSEHEKHLQRIKDLNESMRETEEYYNQVRDENRAKSFKEIEDEIRLRKARGENSAKLDDLEIAKKKEVVQAQLEVLENLKKTEFERTKIEISQSEARIAQIDKELKAVNKEIEEKGKYATARTNRKENLEERKREAKNELEIQKLSLFQNSKLTQEEVKKLHGILSDLDKDKAVKDAQFRKEESEKERKERERKRKEYLAYLKQAENDEFALREFRLKNAIDINKQISDNEKESIDDRLDAEHDKNQLDEALSRETLEHKLKNISWYDDAVRDLTQDEIDTLVTGGTIKKKLLNSEKLAIEQHVANIAAINKKRTEDLQKIIDSEASIIQKRIESETAEEERKLNEAIEFENKKFLAVNDLESMNQADRERKVKEHEQKIFDIKKKFALDALKLQIDGLQKELDDNDAREEKDRVSAEVRKKIAEDLQKARTDYSQLETENYVEEVEKRVEAERAFAEKVKELTSELTSALGDLANAIFERRISNIDDEINKNEEYYNRQIELAGNDAAQKALLEQEAEKKRQELEKKKRKEQQKQAIFNKALAITEIGLKTAMAIVAALAVGPPQGYIFAAISGAIGAAQLAAVLASPIPKYKHGRTDGPDEVAWVGDGGVREVVENPDGSTYITPNVPTLTYLEKGAKVYSSEEDFAKAKRAAVMTSLAIQTGKMNDYQASLQFDYSYSKEMVREMKLTRKAIEKNKGNSPVIYNKVDLGHEIWKSKNTNWS